MLHCNNSAVYKNTMGISTSQSWHVPAQQAGGFHDVPALTSNLPGWTGRAAINVEPCTNFFFGSHQFSLSRANWWPCFFFTRFYVFWSPLATHLSPWRTLKSNLKFSVIFCHAKWSVGFSLDSIDLSYGHVFMLYYTMYMYIIFS